MPASVPEKEGPQAQLARSPQVNPAPPLPFLPFVPAFCQGRDCPLPSEGLGHGRQ
jgi:hypothetical protein